MNPDSKSIMFDFHGDPKSKAWRNIIIFMVIMLIFLFFSPEMREFFALIYNNPAQIKSFLIILFLATIFVVPVSFLFFFRKTFKSFGVDASGILVNGINYAWEIIKDYHMLGDSQDERTGIIGIRKMGGYDPVNIYAGMNIFVLRIKSGLKQYEIRLQTETDRVREFEQILEYHGIVRESKTKMYFTHINKWFIVLFVVPFLLFILWAVYNIISKT